MKNVFWPAMAAVTAIATASAVYAAPGDQAARVRGQVSAVDGTAKSITVTNPRDQTITTFKVTDATTYLVDVPKKLDSLKVGDNVHVMGRPDDNGNVTARFILIVPPGQAAGGPAGGGGRGGRRGLEGAIATLQPTLTVTTGEGKTVVVATSADTQVAGTEAGSWSDVKKDVFVNADVAGDPGAQVATTVHVSSNMGWGRGGRGGAPGAPPAAPAQKD